MKQKRALTALLAALLLLTGCGLVRNSYVTVYEHRDPYAYKEEPTTESETEQVEPTLQTASNYYAILSILRGFVSDGIEHGQFLIENYRGDLEQDLQNVFHALKTEDPIGAYAIDYIDYFRTWKGSVCVVTVDAVYRRSTSEIEAIRPVRGNERAMAIIRETLDQLGTSVTLQISGYQEEDLVSSIHRYCLEHPNIIVQMPEISVSIYPETGNVRVVELHFIYDTDRDTLRGMQNEVESVLNSADRYARYAPEELTRLTLVFSYLTSRFPYTEDETDGSVYRLLCEGVGNSESFASITAYLCQRIGVSCIFVEGTRTVSVVDESGVLQSEEAPYVWNIVCLDGQYYHIDLQADALAGNETCTLLIDEEMNGYFWNRDAYPTCSGAETEPAPEQQNTP